MGIGSICQVLPFGRVPSDTNVELSGSIVPLDIIILEFPEKGMGVCWKQSSVRSEPRGQRRYCQPPPERAESAEYEQRVQRVQRVQREKREQV
jgi:hypothetical protein